MSTNTITTTPSVAAYDEMFAMYRAQYGATKTRTDFYVFLTTPSTERDDFYADNSISVDEKGNVVVLNVATK